MKFYVYRDAAEMWRWRLRAADHKIIADSAQGYTKKTECYHAISLVKAATNATVVEISSKLK